MTKTLFLNRLLVLLLVFAFPTAGLTATEAVARIAFFRAIRDKAMYAKSPAKYEHVVVNDRTGKDEYYIERQPVYVIPKIAIESITVWDAEHVTATGEPFPGTKSNSQSKSKRPVPRYYEIIFKIKSPEGKKFSIFTEKNKQSFFEMTIGKQRLGLQQFDSPFEHDESGSMEFKIYFLETDADSSTLKEMLSPFKELVIWK